ncbi:MAG: hypothetical protein WC671_01850 [Candidatus Paceibacterota bacterium]
MAKNILFIVLGMKNQATQEMNLKKVLENIWIDMDWMRNIIKS